MALSAQLDAAYAAGTYPLTTYEAAWCDVTTSAQRKEAFGILVFRNVGFKVEMPTGSQTAIDSMPVGITSPRRSSDSALG